MTNRE
jgi:hypothetical protein